MFSIQSESSHPFSYYKIGEVRSCENYHYLRVYSDVLWVLKDMGEYTCTAKCRVYNNHVMNEYDLYDYQIEEFKKRLTESKKLQVIRESKLKQIQKPISGARNVDFLSREAVTVLQHEYAVTDAKSEQPVLGTFGASTCVILALYDSKSKMAILAHVDSLTDVDSLSVLLSNVSVKDTVAHLYGGYSILSTDTSKYQCMQLVELLEKNNVSIVNADIARKSSDTVSMAIDARTGAIYAPVQQHQLNKTPDIDNRLIMTGLQIFKSDLHECYNGLNKPRQSSVNSLSSDVRLSDLPSPLGFLSSQKSQQPGQSETFCGFKSGFLNQKLFNP